MKQNNGWSKNVVKCFDNKETSMREWWLNNDRIYKMSAGTIAELGRTVFGAFPEPLRSKRYEKLNS